MQISLESLEAKLLEENLKKLFQTAYDQGMADAKEKLSLPQMLRKTDVAAIFQVELATVEKIIRMEGFPKSKVVTARYPRDQVLEWANENIERVNFHHRKAI